MAAAGRVTRATRRRHDGDELPVSGLDVALEGDAEAPEGEEDEAHARRPVHMTFLAQLAASARGLLPWQSGAAIPAAKVTGRAYGQRLGAVVALIFVFGPELFEFSIVANVFRFGIVAGESENGGCYSRF